MFGEATQENVNRRFAIVLDNQVITAPVIREPIIGGSGQITGNFTVESANDLAVLLRAGALPATLDVIEERVGRPEPRRGLDQGRRARLRSSAAILVVTFMLVDLRAVRPVRRHRASPQRRHDHRHPVAC